MRIQQKNRKNYVKAPDKIPFTKEGYDALLSEQQLLKQKRPQVVATLAKAREMGDLSENGYYKAAKQELISTDRRLRTVAYLIKQAQVVEKTKSNVITIGSEIILEEAKKQIHYTLVGAYEANPREGKISAVSPLGKQLLGKKAGETLTVLAPVGAINYKIISIS